MPQKINLIAGENITIEKKQQDFVIHSIHESAGYEDHGGFFKLELYPVEEFEEKGRGVISNCMFRVNGRYYRIADYPITDWYSRISCIYLHLEHEPEKSYIMKYDFDSEDELEIFTETDKILLYIVRFQDGHAQVQPFAASGMIDTLFLQEGFVFSLEGSGIYTTCTCDGERRKYFFDQGNGDVIYIPCYSTVKKEGVNIYYARESGGVLQLGSQDEYYQWRGTGLPSTWQDEVITVKVNPQRVYF